MLNIECYNQCRFIIYYSPNEIHDMFIQGQISCRGKERTLQSIRLNSSSSSKCQTENFIYNKNNEKFGNYSFNYLFLDY